MLVCEKPKFNTAKEENIHCEFHEVLYSNAYEYQLLNRFPFENYCTG